MSVQFGVMPRSTGPLARRLGMEKPQPCIRLLRLEWDEQRSRLDRRVRLSEAGLKRRRETKVARLNWFLHRILNKPKTGYEILVQVAREHQVRIADITGASRQRKFVRIKQEVAYTIATKTGMSLGAIGHLLNKDHTTILLGIRQHACLNKLPLPRGMKLPHRFKERNGLISSTNMD